MIKRVCEREKERERKRARKRMGGRAGGRAGVGGGQERERVGPVWVEVEKDLPKVEGSCGRRNCPGGIRELCGGVVVLSLKDRPAVNSSPIIDCKKNRIIPRAV